MTFLLVERGAAAGLQAMVEQIYLLGKALVEGAGTPDAALATLATQAPDPGIADQALWPFSALLLVALFAIPIAAGILEARQQRLALALARIRER